MNPKRNRLARALRAFVRAWNGDPRISKRFWVGSDSFKLIFMEDPESYEVPEGTTKGDEDGGNAGFWIVPLAKASEVRRRSP